MRIWNRLLAILAVSVAASTGCVDGEIGEPVGGGVPEDYEEVETSVAGIANSFNAHNVIDDAMFTDTSITGDMIQGFLENTPYFGGTRCWLADHTVNGMRASDALVQASRSKGVSPLMLLARLQVEKSAVSKSSRPSQKSVDYTMGCGCHDGQACNTAFKGFDKQMECAADTLRKHYDGSSAGTGAWRKGKARQTLDPETITPANNATASLYAYTPWVLRGAGGNWLVWNVTKKYANAMASVTPSTGGGTSPTPDPDPTPQPDPDPTPTPDPTPNPDPTTDYGTCSVSGDAGQCIDTGATSCDGDTYSGYCPGSNAIRCCVPNSSPLPPSTDWGSCSFAGQSGECIDTNTEGCFGDLFTGVCPGPSAVRCCI